MTQLTKQINEYLIWCEFERVMTPQTMRSKRYILKAFASQITKKDASKITEADLSVWRRNQIKAGVSPRTVNNRIAHVIAFFKYLTRKGSDLKINTDAVELCKVQDVQVQFYTKGQVKHVLEHCKGLRDYLLIKITFEAGLRIHELAKLQVEDFDHCHVKVMGKGRALRDTFILPETKVTLDKWLAMNDIQSGYIFESPYDYSNHLSVDMIRLIMKGTFKKAGIENFNPHALRHSFATELIAKGADLITVQTLLGHKDPKTTRKYIHLMTQKLQAAHMKYLSG